MASILNLYCLLFALLKFLLQSTPISHKVNLGSPTIPLKGHKEQTTDEQEHLKSFTSRLECFCSGKWQIKTSICVKTFQSLNGRKIKCLNLCNKGHSHLDEECLRLAAYLLLYNLSTVICSASFQLDHLLRT